MKFHGVGEHEVFRPTRSMIFQYIIHLAKGGATSNSLLMFKSAASHFAIRDDFFDIATCPRLGRLLKGAAKCKEPSSRTLTAISLTQLQETVWHCYSIGDFPYWRTVAAMAVAFSAFLRISEARNLQRQDITIEADRVRVHIKTAKRKPTGFSAVFNRDSVLAKFLVRYLRKFNFLQADPGAYVCLLYTSDAADE